MARAVSPTVSEFYERVHRDAGVRVPSAAPASKRSKARAKSKPCARAANPMPAISRWSASASCPMASSRIGRARTATTASVVNEFAADGAIRPSMPPAIARAIIGRDGHPIRLEFVQNAIDQAKHAALAMTGKPTPYNEVPWFWSDQYDLKLQIAGLAWPDDQMVLRGDPAARKFAVFHLREGRVAAVESVNAAPEYLVGRKLIAEATTIAPEKLADSSIPMKNIA